VPNILAIAVVIGLLLRNLHCTPKQSDESPITFAAAVLSSNFSVFIAACSSWFPFYGRGLSQGVATVGMLLNLLSMPFYVWAVTSLGRSFAILPEANKLRTNGVYGISRHPIYMTYIIWCITQNMIYQSWAVLLLSPIQILLFVYRAKQEEKVLMSAFSDYVAYKQAVSWLGGKRAPRANAP
jgi:protein-S-isoprenylcysteine O-methyltransferase Ste14